MPKLKKARTTGYTKVANVCFFDKRLSFKDVGMYCAMLLLPDDWEWSLKGLEKLHTDKIDSIRTSVNHLLELGYISRRQTKDANGRFRDIEYSSMTILRIIRNFSGCMRKKKRKQRIFHRY